MTHPTIKKVFTLLGYAHIDLLKFSLIYCGSSRPEVFLVKGVPKISSKCTGEHPCRSVISIKLLPRAAFAPGK